MSWIFGPKGGRTNTKIFVTPENKGKDGQLKVPSKKDIPTASFRLDSFGDADSHKNGLPPNAALAVGY